MGSRGYHLVFPPKCHLPSRWPSGLDDPKGIGLTPVALRVSMTLVWSSLGRLCFEGGRAREPSRLGTLFFADVDDFLI